MKNQHLFNSISETIDTYTENIPLPGISTPQRKEVFIKQICDSIRRIELISTISLRDISPWRADPNTNFFDPLRAAIYFYHNGNINEAAWMVFLFTHFGKHYKTNYNLCRNFYGALGIGTPWTWDNTINNIDELKLWLDNNREQLKNDALFGNHRKYQSIGGYNNSGTGSTIESYINLIGKNHVTFFDNVPKNISSDKFLFFDYLYKLFNKHLIGFGRLAVFDYLTMLGKVGIVDIEPNSPYIQNATGPKKGTKLLFGTPNASNKELNTFLQDLGNTLGVPFSMQVIEDATCNWQKSPDNYRLFRG